MRVSHAAAGAPAVFDDPNLVSCAGLAPVLALAARCGLHDLVADIVRVPGAGVHAEVKVPAILGGMVAGADSIADLDVLRHGGMGRLFDGVRAPSTLGTFLRAFTHGHVRQLDAVAARFLERLAAHTPLLPGAEQVTFVDVDDTIRATYGYAKQGAGYGYSGVKGLNALLVTVSTPLAAPVIAAARLRGGSTNSARGAAGLLAEGLRTATKCGARAGKGAGGGLVLVRVDSAYYGYPMVAATRRAGARFSITARMTSTVTAAISRIDEQAWTPIRYPNAVWDEDEQRLVSDAELAEVPFTAFTSRKKAEHVTARLIVRRVRRLNPASAPNNQQGELFAAYRYHAVFTDSPLELVQAEAQHRGHAIVEQVIADLKAGPLAHLPSGKYAANAAWLALAGIAFNLTRAAGTLASAFHAKATPATIRRQLINVPARLARSARRLSVHLPRHWPWQAAWEQLHAATTTPTATGPPRAA